MVAVTLITGMVLGGAGTVSGAVVGAVAIVWLPELTKGWTTSIPFLSEGEGAVLSDAVYGVVLILVVFLMPGGVISFVRRLRARVVRFVPRLPEPAPSRTRDAVAVATPNQQIQTVQKGL